MLQSSTQLVSSYDQKFVVSTKTTTCKSRWFPENTRVIFVYMVRQFNSRNDPLKTKFVYLYTNGCCCLRNTLLPRNFLVVNVRNQGKTLCSPCIIIYMSTNSNVFMFFYVLRALFCIHATIHPPTTIYKWRQNCSQHWQFTIFAILHCYNFTLVTDTAVQNNDNEISLHFKPMRLIFMNYSV